MPAQKPISREYRIYLALWRKAVLNPDNIVVIKAPSYSMAIAMRQGMYRAIRPFRNGLMTDEELRTAAEKYVVYLDKAGAKDDPHELSLRPRAALAELELMFDDLGIDEEDLRLGDERAVLGSLEKLLEKEKPKAVSTPFYTRDD